MSVETLPKIFVCEDDPDIQIIIEMSLSDLGGANVTIFSSGAEFFAGLENDMPELVILDVMLPEMDGPTILKKLKANDKYKHLPVIFMTAKIRPMDLADYKGLDVLGVIGKPFDPADVIDKIFDYWTNFKSSKLN